MKNNKLTNTNNNNKELVDTNNNELVDTNNNELVDTESQAERKPKKGELTNRKYSTLLDAANANGIDFDDLKTEAVTRLKDVIETAYASIKRLHDSKTPVSDFIRMSRAEQSNKVLQISSGSLEQRLGYDREKYTSVTKATTPDEAVLYTLLACIGWDATARLCGIKDAQNTKKTKSETNSTVVIDF